MDLDLKELASTLAIGAFFLFGIEFIFWAYFGKNLSSTILKRAEINQYVLGVFAVALCFAVGMVMEDVSNKFVDRDTIWNNLMSSDDLIKARALFGSDLQKTHQRHLAASAAQYGLLAAFGGENGELVQKRICQKKPINLKDENGRELNEDDLIQVAQRFYYQAKNSAYEKETYYDELRRIQLRIDFARSFSIISLILLSLMIVICVLQGLRFLFKLRKIRAENPQALPWRQIVKKLETIAAPLSLVAALLIIATILGAFAYSSEEREFDSRAYGYYISLRANAASKPEINMCLPAPSPSSSPASSPTPSAGSGKGS